MPPTTQSDPAEPSAESTPPQGRVGLDSRLAGRLPCVVCGYDLRSLSIRSVCPECGSAVRATILHLVDPHAQEFLPIRHPRLVAAALIAWVAGALLAAIAAWAPHLSRFIHFPARRDLIAGIVLAGIVASGIGAILLVRPYKGIPRVHSLFAALAAVCYLPLAWTVTSLYQLPIPSYGPRWTPIEERLWHRLAIDALVVLIALGMRLNARLLVQRSLVMRMGRVDRQTLYALAAAALVMGIGDTLLIISIQLTSGGPGAVVPGAASGGSTTPGGGIAGIAAAVGLALIVLGSGLVTLGIAGALADAWRIARAIRLPGPSLTQVVERDA